MQRLDLKILDAHQDIVDTGIAQAGERVETLFIASSVHQVAGRLGHEQHHSGGQDNRRGELDTDRNFPRCDGLRCARAADEVRPVADLSGQYMVSSGGDLVSLTQKLVMIPNVIESCCTATSEPRISGGA